MFDLDSDVSVNDGVVYVHTTDGDTAHATQLVPGALRGIQIYSDWYAYPTYHYCQTIPSNKFEAAFKVVQKLMEKKLAEVRKVEDFIELVNEIATIL